MLENLIRETVVPILREAHFKRKAHVWNRHQGDFVDAIDIQKSRFAAPDTEEFTLNIGIFIPEFYKIVWEEQHTGFVKGYEGVVTLRIGQLLPNAAGKTLDKWWVLDSHSNLKRAKVEVGDALRTQVVPFFESLRTLQDIHDFMMNMGDKEQKYWLFALYLAIVKFRLGDLEGCKRMLSENRATERAARVRATLGIEG